MAVCFTEPDGNFLRELHIKQRVTENDVIGGSAPLAVASSLLLRRDGPVAGVLVRLPAPVLPNFLCSTARE
jgi:hypothetical protein